MSFDDGWACDDNQRVHAEVLMSWTIGGRSSALKRMRRDNSSFPLVNDLRSRGTFVMIFIQVIPRHDVDA